MKRVALAAALVVALPLLAQESRAEAGAAHYFHDLKLVDQNGRTVDLYDDVMKGHVVVINSFFATCKASCIVMSGNYLHLQKRFGDRLGKELRLVSITVDPQNDTPAALKKYAEQMKAGQGWMFLTGSKEQVDAALRKLGLAVADRDAHMNTVIVGNLATGLWKKVLGVAKAEDVATAVESVLDDKGPA